MRIALFQPDIPQNTGTILRLAASLGIEAHIVEPAGFPTTDRAFRRAGMDYLLARQNADGSWGDMREKDIYKRYHPTWNAVAALSNYAWRAPTPTPPKLRLLHSLGTDGASRMY